MEERTGIDNWSFDPGETSESDNATVHVITADDDYKGDQNELTTTVVDNHGNGHRSTREIPDHSHSSDHGNNHGNGEVDFNGHLHPTDIVDILLVTDQYRPKVRRHHTDLSNVKIKPPPTTYMSDIIIEDDYDMDTEPSILQKPSKKKPALIARHHTDVLRKRTWTPKSDLSSDGSTALVTRRSISRHGSRAQQMSKSQCVGEETSEESIKILKSRHSDAFIERKTKLTSESNQQLRAFKHSMESNAQHVHTQSFEQARTILENTHVILISGSRGSGKTHMAMKLMETMVWDHPGLSPFIINSIQDITILNDISSKSVVFVDDVLGKCRRTHECLSELGFVWNNLQYMMERSKCYVILTCDSGYLHDIQSSNDSGLVKELHTCKCVVGLDQEGFKLTKDEKTKLVRMVGRRLHSSFKSSDMDRLVRLDNDKYGLPIQYWLISIGASADDLEKSVDHFLEGHLTTMFSSDFQKYVTLIIILVFGGRLKMSRFCVPDKKVLDHVAALFDVDEETINETNLKDVAKKLVGKYLKKSTNDEVYVIANDILKEALSTQLLHTYGEKALHILPIWVLAGLNIRSRDKSENYESDSKLSKHVIEPNNFKCLAERFKEILSTENPDLLAMSSCSVWEDDTFSEIALTIIGVDDIIIKKDGGLTLLAALAHSDRRSTVAKIVNYITKYRQDTIKEKVSELNDALKVACRFKRAHIVNMLARCCEGIDDAVMVAAAEGGDEEIIEALQRLGGLVFDKKGEVMQTLCRNGHDDVFKRLLGEKTGPSLLNKKGHKGSTLLHSAVISTRVSLVEYMISLGADPGISNREGVTILHLAADYGRLETVQLLASRFPNLLGLTDHQNFTVLHYAAREGHVDVVNYLIQLDVPGDTLLPGNNTILHIAAYNGHTDVLMLLWNKYPELTKSQNNESFTAPQTAARMGHVSTLQSCIDAGVSNDFKTVDGRTVLHLAAYNGQLNLVKHLCSRYRRLVDITDTDGNTVAHDAAASGSVKVLDYILRIGHVNATSVNNDGCSVLHDACYYGRLEASVYLIDRFPDLISMKTTSGYTPCHGVALGGFIELFKVLVSRGSDPLALSDDHSTVLHEAAFSGKVDMVKYLCTTYPQLLTYRNKMDYTAIHFAAQEGHLEVFSYLLTETKDPLCKTGDNQTFLHIAAFNRQLDVVKYICDEYPEMLEAQDTAGALALHYAARGGSVEICALLIEKQNFNPGVKTSSGSTVLHLACFDGKIELVKFLCHNYPALVNAIDGNGHNAAHYAAGSGSVELLETVLEMDVDPMLRTDNGSTILLKAAYNGHTEVVRYICSRYPEMIRITDHFGCNLAHYAVCVGNVNILMYTLESMIDPMGVTSEGHTLLHIAAFHGQMPIVKFLCEAYPEMKNIVDAHNLAPEDYAMQGQQDHVVQYLVSINSKRKMSYKDTKRDDDDTEDGKACQPCRDCTITCFRCQCTRDCGISVVRTVWGRIVGLVCVCRRS